MPKTPTPRTEAMMDDDVLSARDGVFGTSAICWERYRQREREGWTAERDDAHAHGELATAAVGYITGDRHKFPISWPFKPSTRIRDLTKAGALIAAELDRLKRAEAAPMPTKETEALSKKHLVLTIELPSFHTADLPEILRDFAEEFDSESDCILNTIGEPHVVRVRMQLMGEKESDVVEAWGWVREASLQNPSANEAQLAEVGGFSLLRDDKPCCEPTSEETEAMGERVRQMRSAKEISLSELARRSGLTKSYICRVESLKPPNVSVRVAEQLAAALDVAPAWLVWGEGQ